MLNGILPKERAMMLVGGYCFFLPSIHVLSFANCTTDFLQLSLKCLQ